MKSVTFHGPGRVTLVAGQTCDLGTGDSIEVDDETADRLTESPAWSLAKQPKTSKGDDDK